MKKILLAMLVALPLAASAQVPAQLLADGRCPQKVFEIRQPARQAATPNGEPRSESTQDTMPTLFAQAALPPPLNLPMVQQQIPPAGAKGQVVVQVLVDDSGYPIAGRISTSDHGLLCGAVLRHIHLLRFAPYRDSSGKPGQYWVSVPFHF